MAALRFLYYSFTFFHIIATFSTSCATGISIGCSEMAPIQVQSTCVKHNCISIRQTEKENLFPIGFHEAIGDTIALSVSTPAHLQKLGLLPETSTLPTEPLFPDQPPLPPNGLYLFILNY